MKFPAVVALVAALGLLVMGWAVLPVPDRDASYFLGTAVSVGSGEGMVNRHDAFLMEQDPTHQARFVSYPPAFPLVVGLLGGGTIRGTTMVIALMGAAAVLMCGLLFGQLAGTAHGPARWEAAVATIGFATAFSNGAYRPEALSAVLVLLGALALLRVPDGTRRDLLLGALLGALVHVQIPVTLYSVAFLSAFVAVHHRTRQALMVIARGTGAAILVGAIGLWLHPYGGRAYLKALLGFAGSVAARPAGHGFLDYWVFGVRFPGLLLTLGLAAALGLWRLRGAAQKPRSPLLFALAVLSGTAIFVRMSLLQPPRWYDVTAFLPLVYIVLILALARPAWRSPAMRWLVLSGLLVTMINAGGYLRRFAMAIPPLAGETTHARAADRLRRDLAELGGRGMIATSPQAWMLLSDVRWACVLSMQDEGTTCQVLPRLYVLQQARLPAGAKAPDTLVIVPELGGSRAGVTETSAWRLVRSRFESPPGPHSVLNRGRVNAWGYAIYRRELPSDRADRSATGGASGRGTAP